MDVNLWTIGFKALFMMLKSLTIPLIISFIIYLILLKEINKRGKVKKEYNK